METFAAYCKAWTGLDQLNHDWTGKTRTCNMRISKIGF